MSSKNNVNPDHYKGAGRERQGEDIVHSVQKQRFAETEARMKRSRGDAANAIPEASVAGSSNQKDEAAPAARQPKRARSRTRHRIPSDRTTG
jgi:hypothetical protein